MSDSAMFWDDPDEPEKIKKSTWALIYEVPLRKDFMAQFLLPYDLSTTEAERISAMLRTCFNI